MNKTTEELGAESSRASNVDWFGEWKDENMMENYSWCDARTDTKRQRNKRFRDDPS